MSNTPRIVDNDRDEITATLDGKEIRGWTYANETERRIKMLIAREFTEGWFRAMRQPDLQQALADCDEYFDSRADADQPAGDSYPTPNEEMRLQLAIGEFLNA